MREYAARTEASMKHFCWLPCRPKKAGGSVVVKARLAVTRESHLHGRSPIWTPDRRGAGLLNRSWIYLLGRKDLPAERQSDSEQRRQKSETAPRASPPPEWQPVIPGLTRMTALRAPLSSLPDAVWGCRFIRRPKMECSNFGSPAISRNIRQPSLATL